MSVQHKDKNALNLWAREIASAGTGMAPGLCQLVGGRPKVSPCLKLFSFLFPKTSLPATIQLNEDQITYTPQTSVLSSNSGSLLFLEYKAKKKTSEIVTILFYIPQPKMNLMKISMQT